MTCLVKDWKHAVGEKKAFYKLFAAECNKFRAYSKRELNFPDSSKINPRAISHANCCCLPKTGFFLASGRRVCGYSIIGIIRP